VCVKENQNQETAESAMNGIYKDLEVKGKGPDRSGVLDSLACPKQIRRRGGSIFIFFLFWIFPKINKKNKSKRIKQKKIKENKSGPHRKGKKTPNARAWKMMLANEASTGDSDNLRVKRGDQAEGVPAAVRYMQS
jgi:hypothetical protein